MRILNYIIMLMLILLIPTLAHASKRVALVIGNSQYTNAGTLTNPVNDAMDVAEALRKLNFTVLLGTDTDYAAMRKLLQDFSREVSDADVATLYYAGHGMSVGGENYLLPVDAKLDSRTDLDFQALSLSLVQRQMEQSASTRLIFLDACRNNPLTRSWTSASRSAADKGLSSPTGRTKGTYIAFATEPGNVALDGEGTRNSPFSAAFLKHITSPGLELASLMKRVRRDVTITTNDQQVPWSNSGLIGDFYFNPAEPKAEITPDPIPEPKSNNDELALWNEVKDSGDADLINHFVAKFPDSIYAGLAEVKLQKLAVLITPKDVTKTLDNLTEEAKRSIDTCHRLAATSDKKNGTDSGVKFSELKKSPFKAISACEQAVQVKPGNPTLQFQLGRALDAAARYAEALRWYRKAADQGDSYAQYRIGFLYQVGQGVDKDYTKAAQWYLKAAERGNASAQTSLAYLYKHGQGVNKDYAEALRWYRKAAEQGDLLAQSSLAHFYKNGYGVDKDFTEAARWFRKAADQGDLYAQTSLAHFYKNGQGVNKDYAEALRWYRKAADQGDIYAQTSIGYLYKNGQGVNKDYAEALRWFRKAAEQGDIFAQTSIGYLYENGQGVNKDYAEAARWFRKAADQGDMYAQNSIGYLYGRGLGVNKDYAEAARWYRKAADQGDYISQFDLGRLYEEGKGVAKDPQMAAQLLFAAVKQGHQRSIDYVKDKRSHSKEFRLEMQRLLKEDGVFSGSVDGSFGPNTMTAIEKYAKK